MHAHTHPTEMPLIHQSTMLAQNSTPSFLADTLREMRKSIDFLIAMKRSVEKSDFETPIFDDVFITINKINIATYSLSILHEAELFSHLAVVQIEW
jgi:hypothetical protein